MATEERPLSAATNDDIPTYIDVPVGIDAQESRSEFDSLGSVDVAGDRYWGAQTQRSLTLPAGRRARRPAVGVVAPARSTGVIGSASKGAESLSAVLVLQLAARAAARLPPGACTAALTSEFQLAAADMGVSGGDFRLLKGHHWISPKRANVKTRRAP
jgi:hypothetical protein